MIVQNIPHPAPRKVEINSTRWLGISVDTVFDSPRLERLKAAIEKANSDLDAIGASNSEKAQAKSLLVAMSALADAPEPPSDLIWKLIERGLAIIGVCELFYVISEAILG